MSKAKHFSTIAHVLTLALIVTGLITSAPFVSTPTFSCPGPPPRPLRQLYLKSASIVVAHVGKSEVVRIDKIGDSDTSMTVLKTALFVSSTLKGSPEPVVYVNHISYGDYQDELSSVADDVEMLVFLQESPDPEFLQKDTDKKGYFVDMNYGLKVLSDVDLKVYESRIEDLAAMMKSGEPSDAQIVEWLVRCAEEPATRWEGTYELSMSQYLREQEVNGAIEEPAVAEVADDEADAQLDQAPVEGEAVSDQDVQVEPYWNIGGAKSSFAKLLKTEQKDRLITALMNTRTLTNNDYSLLELVQKWDDPRIVPYLLTQLDQISKQGQSEELGDYYAEFIMTTVAEKLGDDALKALVKRFSENESEQYETYEDRRGTDETTNNVVEPSPEVKAAEMKAAEQRCSAQLQHFVTLALSTVPKPLKTDSPDTVASTEP